MFDNVSSLNFISILGIGVMIGLAVLMSSNRRRINWRLVGMGVGLQILLAAIFFNSQSWTFPRYFENFSGLATAVEMEVIDPTTTNTSELLEGKYKTLSSLQEAVASGLATQDDVNAEINRVSENGFAVPRFNNGIVFAGVETFFKVISNSVEAGTGFVFSAHPGPDDQEPPTHPKNLLFTFAFGVLPTVIFFAALMSVLYYIGLMQIVIRVMAWVMQKTLGVTGAESLAAAANVLVGHTEAPLVVKPYVSTMTRSELNALMVGGFATISGSLMAIFANLGISAGHLLTASIISAPAALVLASWN